MKSVKVTFIPIDGTGALHLDLQPGPFGDAIEARKGDGMGFSQNGDVQGAIATTWMRSKIIRNLSLIAIVLRFP